MSPVQWFMLGMMAAWTPSFMVLASMLWRMPNVLPDEAFVIAVNIAKLPSVPRQILKDIPRPPNSASRDGKWGSDSPCARAEVIRWSLGGISGEFYGRKYDHTRHWRLSEVWGAEHTGACGL